MKIKYSKYIKSIALSLLMTQLLSFSQMAYADEAVTISSTSSTNADDIEALLIQGFHPLSVLFYSDKYGMLHDEYFDIVESVGLNLDTLKQAYHEDGLKQFMRGGACESAILPPSGRLSSIKKNSVDQLNDSSPIDSIAAAFFDNNEILVDKPSRSDAQELVNLEQSSLQQARAKITLTPSQLTSVFENAGLINQDSTTINRVDDELPSKVGNYRVSISSWYLDEEESAFSDDISTSTPLYVLMLASDNDQDNRIIFSQTQMPLLQAYLQSQSTDIPLVVLFDDTSARTTADYFSDTSIKAADQLNVALLNYHNEKTYLATAPNPLTSHSQIELDYNVLNEYIQTLPDVSKMSPEQLEKAKSRLENTPISQLLMVNGKIYLGDAESIAVQQSLGMPAPHGSITYKNINIDVAKASNNCLQALAKFNRLATTQVQAMNGGNVADKNLNERLIELKSANRTIIHSGGGAPVQSNVAPQVSPSRLIEIIPNQVEN